MNVKILILLIFLLITSALNMGSAMAEMVAVSGETINMRSGPGTKYKILWQLGSGFPLRVLKKKGTWLRVQDFEGTIGWVNKGVVNREPHMIVKVLRKSRKAVNVRSGPGIKYRIVARAFYGVVFKTVERKNGWVKVQHEKGVTGWVKRSLLWGF